MARVSVPNARKNVVLGTNVIYSRSVNKWTSNLQPLEWTPYVGSPSRCVRAFSGSSAVTKSDFKKPTPFVAISGEPKGSTGNYGAKSFSYGTISSEAYADYYVVLDPMIFPSCAEDPRNLTWNIGGYLGTASSRLIYNRLAHTVQKKLAEPIVNLGQIAAESLKTVRGFNKIAVDILQVARFVKRGDIGGAVKIAFGQTDSIALFNRDKPVIRRIKTANGWRTFYAGKDGTLRSKAQLRAMHPAQRWLEYSFGVAPVIQDVQALAELHSDVKSPVYRYASKVVVELSPKARATYRMGCRVTVGDVLARYKQQLGIHKNQVLSLAWELVPLSWLIDYFIDVGGMLSMLHSTTGLKNEGTWWSVKVEVKDLPTSGGAKTIGSTSGYSCSNSFTFYEREIIYGFPYPSAPRLLKVLGNSKQQANLFAFLTSAFSGHLAKRKLT